MSELNYHPELTHLYCYTKLLRKQIAVQLIEADKYDTWQANHFSEEWRGCELGYLAKSRQFAIESEAKLARVKQEWKVLAKGMVLDKDYFIDKGFVYVVGKVS